LWGGFWGGFFFGGLLFLLFYWVLSFFVSLVCGCSGVLAGCCFCFFFGWVWWLFLFRVFLWGCCVGGGGVLVFCFVVVFFFGWLNFPLFSTRSNAMFPEPPPVFFSPFDPSNASPRSSPRGTSFFFLPKPIHHLEMTKGSPFHRVFSLQVLSTQLLVFPLAVFFFSLRTSGFFLLFPVLRVPAQISFFFSASLFQFLCGCSSFPWGFRDLVYQLSFSFVSLFEWFLVFSCVFRARVQAEPRKSFPHTFFSLFSSLFFFLHGFPVPVFLFCATLCHHSS